MKMAFQYWRQCARSHQTERDTFLASGMRIMGTPWNDKRGWRFAFSRFILSVVVSSSARALPQSRVPSSNADTSCADYLAAYEKILQQEGHRIVAIIIEPLVQAAAGIVLHPPGFLRACQTCEKIQYLVDR